MVDEEEKVHVFNPEAAFSRNAEWWGVGAYSYCLVMSLYIKNAHYVCLLCVGRRRLRCFIVPPPPPTSSFCLCIAVSTSQKRIRREIHPPHPPFHQQFMMEHCSTYSPHIPSPPTTDSEVASQYQGFSSPLPSEPMQIKAQIPIDLGAENRRYDGKPPHHLWLYRPHRPQPKPHVYD